MQLMYNHICQLSDEFLKREKATANPRIAEKEKIKCFVRYTALDLVHLCTVSYICIAIEVDQLYLIY